MSLAAKIAQNTVVQIVGKVISTILGLFALAMITRYLGADGFGEYTTITTFLTFFAVIADLGLTLVTVQMLSNPKADEGKTLNNLFSMRLVSAFLFIGLAPLLVIFFPYSQAIKVGVALAAASFIFPALNQVLVGLFQKKLSMDRVSLAEIISRLVLVLALMIARRYELGLNGVLWATVASSLASFVLHYLFAKRYAHLHFAFDISLWRQIFAKSWPLAITIILNLIYLRADTLILSLFRGAAEVGLYGAAYRLIDVLTTVPFIFAGIILPILSSAWLENRKEYFFKILQKSIDIMIIAAIPLMVGAQFLGRPIMHFVAGQDFDLSGDILRALIIGVGAIFIGTMFSHAVIAMDKQKKVIGFYVFTSLSSLIAYFIFVPKYSYFGAAGVTIYSEIVIAAFSAYCVYKYSRFRPKLGIMWRAAGASLIMGLFLNFLPREYLGTLGGLIFALGLSVLIYFLLLYAFGGIDGRDLSAIIKRRSKGNVQTYEPGNF